VQDLIEQDSARIWDLVGKQKAWVYISGYAFTSRDGHEYSSKVKGLPTKCRLLSKRPSSMQHRLKGACLTKRRLNTLRPWNGRVGCLKNAGVKDLHLGLMT
jgi:hypothetical protein